MPHVCSMRLGSPIMPAGLCKAKLVVRGFASRRARHLYSVGRRPGRLGGSVGNASA